LHQGRSASAFCRSTSVPDGGACFIVLPHPSIKIGLQLVNGTIHLFAESDAVKFVEHRFVEPLTDVVGLRALGLGARVIDINGDPRRAKEQLPRNVGNPAAKVADPLESLSATNCESVLIFSLASCLSAASVSISAPSTNRLRGSTACLAANEQLALCLAYRIASVELVPIAVYATAGVT
jgi:hypothetical protein